MAATGEERTTRLLLLLMGLLLVVGCTRATAQDVDDTDGSVFDDLTFEDEELEEDSEYFEIDDIESLIRSITNSSDCDWSQFGSNHTVNLTPLDECEKFKMDPGPIYLREISEDDKKAILEIHNNLRSRVAAGKEKKGNPGPQPSATNIQELVWNDQLAVAAQAWADQCAVKHDKHKNRQTCDHRIDDKRYTGQNVAHKRGKPKKPTTWHSTKFIQSLYKEVKNMPESFVEKFGKPPKGNIGHYTQVIWARTQQVGCGVVYYKLYKKKPNGTFRTHKARSFVCNYFPSGNIKGGQVYERGDTASNCKNGVSTNYPSLCAPPSE